MKRKKSRREPVELDRMRFLRTLEAVSPGLSKKDSTEQSASFAFVNKNVWTYNDKLACRAPSGLPESMEGAVRASQLLAVLRDRPDDNVRVSITDTDLVLEGIKSKSGSVAWDAMIRMDAEVSMPLENVERPKKEDWNALPDEFGTAVQIVQECASKDESEFAFTCVHVHPKYVEACDNMQLTRYRIKTKVKEQFIVERDSIRHITGLDMTQFAETNAWVHFRNPARVQLSCRRHLMEFPNLSEFLKVEGAETTLPKGVAKDARFAEIFSKEVEDRNLVVVYLKDNRLTVRGVGVASRGRAHKKVKYAGKPIAFAIAPRLLAEITKRHAESQISKDHLRVDGERWTFVTCLESADKANRKAEKAAEVAAMDQETPGDTEDE